jgi:3-hydroxybutyryl-CoA dehydrogenase
MTAEIKTIAVIGASELGREFASAALLAGYRVILEDVSENRLARAVDWIARANPYARLRLVLASTVEGAVREADLIIEAVAEEMEMKIEMFSIFDKFAKPNAIFASSSSSLSIAELAAVTFCPERCVGLRLVSSSPQMDAVELARTPQTSEEIIARCREVGRRMGKEIIVTVDVGPRRQDASATNAAIESPSRQDALRGSGQACATNTSWDRR